MALEMWKAVPGYEGAYEVSDLGNVRSLDRAIVECGGKVRRLRGNLLKPAIGSHGRRVVGLMAGGVKQVYLVAHLVAYAHIGPRPEGLLVLHDDGNCVNDLVTNLKYGTPSENMFDRVRHGRHHEANKEACPKGHDYRRTTSRGRTRRYCPTCNAGG